MDLTHKTGPQASLSLGFSMQEHWSGLPCSPPGDLPDPRIELAFLSIKDRNGMDLTEAEDIEKRWQEYTELYKKDLHNPDHHHGVITHLEPDVLECEVK